MSLARALVQSLLHLFYPEVCRSCQRPLAVHEDVLCLHCIMQLPRTQFFLNPDNRVANIFIGRIPIESALSFVYFTKDGMVQDLLHQLKYRGRKEIADALGKLFAEEVKFCDWLKDIDGIVPVPLHKKKERIRGFNQAALFAQSFGAVLGIPVLEHAVCRMKYTESQTNKTRKSRMENVEGVFGIADKSVLYNKHLLLVDDVLTTGATIESLALELRKLGGVRVSIATIAIAEN